MKGVEIWDTEQNFWKLNPHFKIPKAFNDLYTEDKSKDKKDSSQIMWALALYTDTGSFLKELSDSEKKELIVQDYTKGKFDFKKYQDQIKSWEIFKTPMQKQLEQWKRLMNEKNKLLEEIKFSLENWEEVEKMLLSNDKLQAAYDKLVSRLAEEADNGTTKGEQEESLSEKGII